MLSAISIARLKECHKDLQRVVELAASRFPMSVLCGHRGQVEQDKAYAAGTSKVKWPNSKHNKVPAEAVDLCPIPLDWKNMPRFRKMAEVVQQAALDIGVEIVWGGDFKTFSDMPHFELATPKPKGKTKGAT